MQCHACGIPAPSSAKYCPKCGVKIAESAADTGTPLHDSTVALLSHSPQQEATIGSGSPSHAEPQQNQPKHSILHNVPPGWKVNRFSLGIGLGLLVLLLVGSGLFILLGQSKKMGTQRSTLLQNPYPPHTGTLVLNNPLSWNSNGYYYFYISKFGVYDIDIYNGNNSVNTLSSGTIPLFHMGLNQTNLIAVIAQDHTIDLYVNLQFIAGVSDSSYSKGQIGVAAEDDRVPTEVVFSHAKVWKL